VVAVTIRGIFVQKTICRHLVLDVVHGPAWSSKESQLIFPDVQLHAPPPTYLAPSDWGLLNSFEERVKFNSDKMPAPFKDRKPPRVFA
jgi:hypothetical protein